MKGTLTHDWGRWMSGWTLLLETSNITQLGLARDREVVATAQLGVGRQQNRWLVPTIRTLLSDAGISAKQLGSIVACVGPGSYTGLRIGITAAKTLAYALPCPLTAVSTFSAVAALRTVTIVGDALNGTVYMQSFAHGLPNSALHIAPIAGLHFDDTPCIVVGHGAAVVAAKLNAPSIEIVEQPSLAELLAASVRVLPATPSELFDLEPLYLRGSAAEEKAKLTA